LGCHAAFIPHCGRWYSAPSIGIAETKNFSAHQCIYSFVWYNSSNRGDKEKTMDVTLRDGQERDRRGIAETVVTAFWDQFKHLTKEQETVIRLLNDSLVPERFFVAVEKSGSRVVGTVAIADKRGYAILVDEVAFRKAFGFVKGSIAVAFLKDEIYRPKAFEHMQAHIDFVAVREEMRGQGLAKGMIRTLLQEKRYKRYTLEVTQGNERVLPLYLQLGFVETGREQVKAARLKGFSFRYLLTYVQE
jgi:ribosomal protein S18 acetylase RimI-like enzyme